MPYSCRTNGQEKREILQEKSPAIVHAAEGVDLADRFGPLLASLVDSLGLFGELPDTDTLANPKTDLATRVFTTDGSSSVGTIRTERTLGTGTASTSSMPSSAPRMPDSPATAASTSSVWQGPLRTWVSAGRFDPYPAIGQTALHRAIRPHEYVERAFLQNRKRDHRRTPRTVLHQRRNRRSTSTATTS